MRASHDAMLELEIDGVDLLGMERRGPDHRLQGHAAAAEGGSTDTAEDGCDDASKPMNDKETERCQPT